MPDNLVCFNCQRNMLLVKDDMFLCRYCGFINYKLKTEHTAFSLSWINEEDGEKAKNVPVMYWTPKEPT